nr:hypothetical protein CFP56_52581 [Quercus suber]
MQYKGSQSSMAVPGFPKRVVQPGPHPSESVEGNEEEQRDKNSPLKDMVSRPSVDYPQAIANAAEQSSAGRSFDDKRRIEIIATSLSGSRGKLKAGASAVEYSWITAVNKRIVEIHISGHIHLPGKYCLIATQIAGLYNSPLPLIFFITGAVDSGLCS